MTTPSPTRWCWASRTRIETPDIVVNAAGSGRHEWTTLLGAAGLGESTFHSVATDHDGNAVVAGDVAGTGPTGRQAVVAKYRVRTGATLWVQLYNATTTGDEANARKLVQQLRQVALDLPFQP